MAQVWLLLRLRYGGTSNHRAAEGMRTALHLLARAYDITQLYNWKVANRSSNTTWSR